MKWHRVRWLMERPAAMRVAARLSRSRGRLRLLDRCTPPPPAVHKPDLAGWESHALAAVWIGHATVLMRIAGVTVLTDPVFSNRVGLGLGLMTAGPRRLVAPALSIRELPKIDLILVSHAHMDHLDRPTLHRLDKRATVVTSRGNADLIADLGFARVIDLDWGDTVEAAGLRITAAPVRHWGARTVFDKHRGYCAFLLEKGEEKGEKYLFRVLFGGDSAYHEGLRGLGPVDLAMLSIGAYDPWIESHATPEQAWAMAGHVAAEALLPIHHRTFTLSREPADEPLRRLLAAAGGEEGRVVVRQVGESWLGGRTTTTPPTSSTPLTHPQFFQVLDLKCALNKNEPA